MEEKIQTQKARFAPEKIYTNQALYATLTASVADGRLCHAYFFYGPRGIGKRTFARGLARAILCRGEGSRPCGECHSCHKFLSGNHPDFFCYDGKRGANAIHIDLIRELRADAYIRPNDGDYKVYLIPGAEDMSIGAANALLKVLEEPPPYAVFLLTACNKDAVPLTIRSRCIVQELYPMGAEESTAALRELFPGRSPEETASAAEISGGVLGRAIELLESGENDDLTPISRRAAESLIRGNEYGMLAAFAQAGQTKERMLALFDRLSRLLRGALLHRLSVHPSADELVVRMALALSPSQIESLSGRLEESVRAVEGNVNIGLLGNYLAARMTEAVAARNQK